jgi:hypothetical protein
MQLLWISAAAALLLSFIFDRRKTWKGVRAGLRMIPDFLIVLAAASLLLAAMLLKSGASTASVAVFITTLMMVGIFTLPVEKRYFGWWNA